MTIYFKCHRLSFNKTLENKKRDYSLIISLTKRERERKKKERKPTVPSRE